MSFQTEIAAALQEVEAILSKSLTWNSTTYACNPSGLSKQNELGPGGFSGESTISFSIRKALFTGALPQPGQSVVFESTTYKIDEVVTDASSAFVRLICIDPNL
jgi:hypothetical protein